MLANGEVVTGEIVMANVRRYRAIASLYRRTATFRPSQRLSLLAQAEEWEHLAVVELEAYFGIGECPGFDGCAAMMPVHAPWAMAAAA
jgi:hypothetical protein